MIESLNCTYCHRFLRRLSLAKLRHVELFCDHCGQWNTFAFNPGSYVLKRRPA